MDSGESPCEAMKVLVLAPPLSSAGGIQRYTACLVRALQEILGRENVQCRPFPDRGMPACTVDSRRELKLRFGLQALWGSTRWQPDLMICTHLALGPIGSLLAQVASGRTGLLCTASRHGSSFPGGRAPLYVEPTG